MLTDNIMATGLTMPLPEMSGADPKISQCERNMFPINIELTVNGFIDAIAFSFAVWRRSQTRAGQEAK